MTNTNNNFDEIFQTLNRIENKLDQISSQINSQDSKLNHMNEHINFVETVYSQVRRPFQSLLSYYTGSSIKLSQNINNNKLTNNDSPSTS